MAIYKVILRYRDNGSGQGWTVTARVGTALSDDAKALADAWNTAYMAVCNAAVRFVDCRVSDEDLYRDMRVYLPPTFAVVVGGGPGNLVPLAEAILLVGLGQTAATLGSSKWYLHGIDSSMLLSSGPLNPAAAAVVALVTASAGFLLQYRKKLSKKKALPIITPPAAYDSYNAEGPYVRRLGNPFFLPGQRARYTRTPATP